MSPPSIVKFKVEFLSRDVPADDRVGQLRDWCVRFNESGLTPQLDGTGPSLGNLSFRLRPNEPAFIITASALSSKQNLAPGDFVTVLRSDPEHRTVYAAGARDPSSESMIHFEIYKRRGDVGAIFHGHDREITAHASLLDVPQTEHERPPGTLELLDEVIKILDRENFLVMKNHGFISLGRDMDEAGNLALHVKKNHENRMRNHPFSSAAP
jgi:L-fuculose-phosphate aldolase